MPEDAVQIAIAVPASDEEELRQILAAEVGEVLAIEGKGFDGQHLTTLVVALTPPLVKALVALYAVRAGANRAISYSHKGIVIKGVSEETLLKLIEKAGKPSRK
jgi:hypothetical protein